MLLNVQSESFFSIYRFYIETQDIILYFITIIFIKISMVYVIYLFKH